MYVLLLEQDPEWIHVHRIFYTFSMLPMYCSHFRRCIEGRRNFHIKGCQFEHHVDFDVCTQKHSDSVSASAIKCRYALNARPFSSSSFQNSFVLRVACTTYNHTTTSDFLTAPIVSILASVFLAHTQQISNHLLRAQWTQPRSTVPAIDVALVFLGAGRGFDQASLRFSCVAICAIAHYSNAPPWWGTDQKM